MRPALRLTPFFLSLLSLLVLPAPLAAQGTIRPDRAYVGTSLAVGTSSVGTDPVRLVGLPSKASETECLWIDASGDVARGTCGGGVTSVGLALPASVFSVSGSPVTSSGTLTGTFINQAAYSVFARGASTGVPSFQALVDSHIPDSLTLGTVSGTPVFSGVVSFPGGIGSSLLPSTTDTYDLGSSSKLWRQGYLGQLNAVLFAEETVSLLGGWFMVTPDAGSLETDVSSVATTVNFGKAMTTGDFVLLRGYDSSGALATEYMTVGSLVSGTTYNVTRNVDGSGANAWPKGAAFAVLGVDGDGRVELNAYDTPRISVIEQGPTYNAQTELVRLGSLDGIAGIPAGKTGIWLGDASHYLSYYDGTLTVAGDGAGITNIDGGNITTGTVAAARIDAAAFRSGGKNALRNHSCLQNVAEWNIQNFSLPSPSLGYGLASWTLTGGGTCYLTSSVSAAGQQADARPNSLLPVSPGDTIEASIYAAPHRGSATMVVHYYDAALGYVTSAVVGSSYDVGCGTAGGTALSGYTRIGGVTTVPAGVALVQFSPRLTSNYGCGDNTSYLFWTHAYLGRAEPNQTALSPWSPPGVTTIHGGDIQTDTLTATQIAANAITTSELATDSVTAAKILAGTITGDRLAATTITGDKIAATTITGAKIAGSTITADKLSVTSLAAVAINTGALTINDTLTMSTGAVLKAGMSGFGVGTGYWLDYNAGSPRLFVGNSGGDYLEWNGSALNIAANSIDLGFFTIDSNGVRIEPSDSFLSGRFYGFIGHDGIGMAYGPSTGLLALYAYNRILLDTDTNGSLEIVNWNLILAGLSLGSSSARVDDGYLTGNWYHNGLFNLESGSTLDIDGTVSVDGSTAFTGTFTVVDNASLGSTCTVTVTKGLITASSCPP